MSETMGQIIKRLRKERNLTQDELAEQLSVTFQAVSKWENDTGMPDISQVVPLSTVFGVSTDVLFGRYGINDDEEIDKIIEKANNTKSEQFGSYYDLLLQYPILHDSLQTYPNNLKLLSCCLSKGCSIIVSHSNPAPDPQIVSECEHMANLVLNYSTDITELLKARYALVLIYSSIGRYEEAEKQVKQFPNHYNLSRENMYAWFYRASKQTDLEQEQRCHNIDELLCQLTFEILPLGHIYMEKQKYQEAVRVYKTTFRIIDAIWEDEKYTPNFDHMQWEHVSLAKAYMKLKDMDNAMLWLENMYEFYSEISKHEETISTGKETTDNPLFAYYEFGSQRSLHELKELMLQNMNMKAFDSIRNTPRFVALVDKIEKLTN